MEHLQGHESYLNFHLLTWYPGKEWPRNLFQYVFVYAIYMFMYMDMHIYVYVYSMYVHYV